MFYVTAVRRLQMYSAKLGAQGLWRRLPPRRIGSGPR